MELQFTEVDDPDWGHIEIVYHPSRRYYSAKLYVEMPNPVDVSSTGFLQFYSEGQTPDHAKAMLERSIIETLAQGGELVERRARNYGRRAYDYDEKTRGAGPQFDRRYHRPLGYDFGGPT